MSKEGQKIIDRALGKLESLLHIVDMVRVLDPRMEAQMLASLLYVARHEDGRYGVQMEDIAEGLGIAQSSVSRNITKLSDSLQNPPGEVLDRAAKRRRPPSKDALRPKFGLGLVYTVEDPQMRRRKIVFMTPKGKRFVNRLMDYAVESRVMNARDRVKRLEEIKHDLSLRDNDKAQYEYRVREAEAKAMTQNLQRLVQMQEEFQIELAKIKAELTYREKQAKLDFESIARRKSPLLSAGYLRRGNQPTLIGGAKKKR
tara:strand:+ start:1275 stop:2045 length:771 start_codon:yes stop_codon:yes gene_type:complete